MTFIIIIIVTRRLLWSVATAPHDVHAPLHPATSVSTWLLFRRQSAVSVSFEGDHGSLRQFIPEQRPNFIAGIQSDYVPEQCMTFLVDYVSNVRQAMLYQLCRLILPSDAQYLTLASHVKRLQPADIICQQGPCVSTQHRTAESELLKNIFGWPWTAETSLLQI